MSTETVEFISKIVKGKNDTGRHKVTHGAHSLTRAFYANEIDRRSSLGILITEWESEYASHLGFSRLRDAPITIKEKVRLAIGNKLFQMFYIPSPTTGKDLRASENMLSRILTELGLKPTAKPVMDLPSYIAQKESESEVR